MNISLISPIALQPKYIAVQLVLLICKLQPLIAQIELTINGPNDDSYPITRKVYGNGMFNAFHPISLRNFKSNFSYRSTVNTDRGGNSFVLVASFIWISIEQCGE